MRYRVYDHITGVISLATFALLICPLFSTTTELGKRSFFLDSNEFCVKTPLFFHKNTMF